MQQYITRRLLLAVVTLIGVSWLICFIMWIIPGNVAIAILGTGYGPHPARQPLARGADGFVELVALLPHRQKSSDLSRAKVSVCNLCLEHSVEQVCGRPDESGQGRLTRSQGL